MKKLQDNFLLRLGGLEPPQENLLEPKSSASTNSATTVYKLKNK